MTSRTGGLDGWQRRRFRIKRNTVSCAMDLFKQHGYDNTTVDAIAEAAGMSPRTLYRYFPCKEDLVFHEFPDSVSLLQREIDRHDGPLLERLREASVSLSEVLEADSDRWVARFRLILEVPTLRARDVLQNERYEQVFREAMMAEMGSDTGTRSRSRLLAGSIMGGIQTAIKMWVESNGRLALPELTRQVFAGLEGTSRPRSAANAAPSRSSGRPKPPTSAGLDFLD